VLEVRALHACYGRAHILADVSLDVHDGEVVVLLGRNGAGKSTTLKTIMGLVPATRGTVRFAGEAIEARPSFQIAQAGLGYVPEDRRVFTDLTVAENLEVGRQAARPGVPEWTIERVCKLFPNLAAMGDRRGSEMSGGEQQMLSIARMLMGNPKCILLDEPSEGLAPVIIKQMGAAIRELKAAGVSVLLAEQDFRFATAVAERAYIIEKGRMRFSGTMAELVANETIRKQYLAV
jgi:branched-chain amino acid transport system ATP-binding protein